MGGLMQVYSLIKEEGRERHVTYTQLLSKLRHAEKPLQVKIQIPNIPLESPWITINNDDLYLEKLDGISIAHVEYDSASNPALNFHTLVDAIFMLLKATREAQSDKMAIHGRALKILTFFISEAARFEILEHTCYVLLKDPTKSCEWDSWAPLIRSWGKLSNRSHPHITNPGSGLVLPIEISLSQSNSYDLQYSTKDEREILSHLHVEFERHYLEIIDGHENDRSSSVDASVSANPYHMFAHHSSEANPEKDKVASTTLGSTMQ